MLQPIFDFVEKFATDFTWKRVVIVVSLLMLIGTTLFIYELETASIQLSKYERTVAIIEKLESLKQDRDESKIVIKNIYSGLSNITDPILSPTAFNGNISTELKQSLIATIPWIFICIFFIPGFLRNRQNANAVGGTLFVALVM